MYLKGLWKPFLVMVVLIGILTFILQSMISKTKDKLEKVENRMELYLGESVTIKGVEYEIVDYSVVNETYILDNGTEVNFKLVEKE